MNKLIAGVMSAVLLTSAGLTTAAPATAQGYSRDYYVSRYCDDNPYTRDCRDWRNDGRRWDDGRYRRFYRDHSSAFPAFVGTLFGFALGAAIGNSLNDNRRGSYNSHVQACLDRYRSYDPGSDTYMGYDGYRHRCRL